MGQIRGVHIETLKRPTQYTAEQIDMACRVAWWLQRGKLVLTVAPEGDSPA